MTGDLALFESLLHEHHYLSYTGTVGMNLKYLVRDRHGCPLACALFGSAAWRCAARDRFIGWSETARSRQLQRITNNTRFLIPAWVQVPHLASHVLGLIGQPLSLGTLTQTNQCAHDALAPEESAIIRAITQAAVVHVDESGLRVAGRLHWLHVACTPELVLLRQQCVR